MPAIAPPPATAAQPTGGRSRPRLSLVTSQATPAIPTGLPSDVADEDPERDRRGVRAREEARRRSRCRRWRARRAARSRSSSTGGRAAAAARSARSPPPARRGPSGRAPASAARGSSRKRSRRPLEVAAGGRVGVGEQAHRQADDDRVDAGLEQRHPGGDAEQRGRRARGGCRQRAARQHDAEDRRPRSAAARGDVLAVDGRDHARARRRRRRRRPSA